MDNANSTANFSSKFSSTYPINGSINVDSNTKPSAIIPSKSSQSNIEEYRSKLLKLNQSFVKWVQFQLSDNPISIWKDGLKVCVIHVYYAYIDCIVKQCYVFQLRPSDLRMTT
jgi:hypothetical protein